MLLMDGNTYIRRGFFHGFEQKLHFFVFLTEARNKLSPRRNFSPVRCNTTSPNSCLPARASDVPTIARGHGPPRSSARDFVQQKLAEKVFNGALAPMKCGTNFPIHCFFQRLAKIVTTHRW